MENLELLRRNELTGVLLPEEVAMLLAGTTMVKYTKGERLIKSGEFVTHIVFVINGFVKLHADFRDKTVILIIHGPGSFAGLTSVLGMDKHHYDISTIEDTHACLIDVEVMRKLIEQNGQFAKALINYTSRKMLHYMQRNILALSQNNIHGRLASTLLYLSKSVFMSNDFDLLLSRKELSQLSNISRENVIKVLYEFNNDGLIRLSGKHVQLINIEQLQRLADIC